MRELIMVKFSIIRINCAQSNYRCNNFNLLNLLHDFIFNPFSLGIGLQSVIQSVLSEIGQALQSNTGTEIIEMPTEYDAIDLDTTRSVASTISLPLSRFYAEYLIPQKPVLIRGGAYAWPAVSDPKRCWKNLVNIRNAAGHRTVPVEFGSHYLEKDFTLQMMTIQEFIDSVILCKVEHTQSGKRKGYLAQHQLFDQIPSLRKDIITPDYCCMTERFEICFFFFCLIM
eukprot:TRINITY_DN8383_c0_g1_i19.p1 TRINITY_DN8383_c0_g1~~TRINITY_DN8383_c0_g1_i19.p1  ORF type:complete len:227 (+),score=38.04 TRINITY_DN8383_c0_g1_i19:632-1312(+)